MAGIVIDQPKLLIGLFDNIDFAVVSNAAGDKILIGRWAGIKTGEAVVCFDLSSANDFGSAGAYFAVIPC